jgi:hypothetical protein
MPKWIAIRAAAVLALMGSAATLVFSLAAAAFLLFSPLRNTGLLTPSLVRISGCVMAAVFAASAVWGLCSGIGILRRRHWARISMVVFGALLAFFGGTGALAMLLVPFPMNPDVDPRVAAFARVSIVAFYAAFTAVGAWWLVLFNRQSVKRYFAEAGPVAETARPVSISIIGWYLIVAAFGTALCGVFRVPTMLFGAVVTGWTTLAVCTVLTAANLYLGAGLLQLDEQARSWSIVYFAAIGANGLAMAIAPGRDAAMRAFSLQFQSYFHMEMPLMTPNLWFLALTSAAWVVLPLWFLVRRRAAFAR